MAIKKCNHIVNAFAGIIYCIKCNKKWTLKELIKKGEEKIGYKK